MCREIAKLSAVIPGRATWREPGIHRPASFAARWIPGSCFARPGKTKGMLRAIACTHADYHSISPHSRSNHLILHHFFKTLPHRGKQIQLR
jgi:hypothetical protein